MREKLLVLLYQILSCMAFPFALIRLLWKSSRQKQYRGGFIERFGLYLTPLKKGGILVHAVSVGETVAAAPIVNQLLEQMPGKVITVSHMTPTGKACAQRLWGDRVQHVFIPYDILFSVNAFLKNLTPEKVVVLETEWWPNFFLSCHKKNIPLYNVNMRLSEQSARHYRWGRALFLPVWRSVRHFCAQSSVDAERLAQLGVDKARISVTGNLKWDVVVNPVQMNKAQAFKTSLKGRTVFLAASTHAGEEPLVFEVFHALLAEFPDILLCIVPRHPERFETVYATLCEQGFKVERRSQVPVPSSGCQVYLCDTMGELSLFYGATPLAFVGASFVPLGGHNLIEAIQMGAAVIMGPFVEHIQQAVEELQAQDAMYCVKNGAAFKAEVLSAYRQPEQCAEKARRAYTYFESQQGTTNRVMEIINAG